MVAAVAGGHSPPGKRGCMVAVVHTGKRLESQAQAGQVQPAISLVGLLVHVLHGRQGQERALVDKGIGCVVPLPAAARALRLQLRPSQAQTPAAPQPPKYTHLSQLVEQPLGSHHWVGGRLEACSGIWGTAGCPLPWSHCTTSCVPPQLSCTSDTAAIDWHSSRSTHQKSHQFRVCPGRPQRNRFQAWM